MRDADQHHALKVGKDCVPCRVLVIDDLYWDTKESDKFIRLLIKEDASIKVIISLSTADEDWATKLSGLNGGTKSSRFSPV